MLSPCIIQTKEEQGVVMFCCAAACTPLLPSLRHASSAAECCSAPGLVRKLPEPLTPLKPTGTRARVGRGGGWPSSGHGWQASEPRSGPLWQTGLSGPLRCLASTHLANLARVWHLFKVPQSNSFEPITMPNYTTRENIRTSLYTATA
jgi:hypothetical protein